MTKSKIKNQSNSISNKLNILGVIIGVALLVATVATFAIVLPTAEKPDQRTKELCREYADRNHKGELAPERWQWFLDQGIDLNEDFDWYESCIKHNTQPVAL